MADESILLTELADNSRRAIITELRSGSRSVQDLVSLTRLKQPNVSNHLAKLKQSGLVIAERSGRQIFYRIASPYVDILLSALRTTLPEQVTPTSIKESLRSWCIRFTDALYGGREPEALSIVQECLNAGVSMEDIYMDVIQASLVEIGHIYFTGDITEAEEHLATAVAERLMSRISQFYETIQTCDRKAVFGCVAGNWHTIGLRMIADIIQQCGWKTIFLGANVPTESFVKMVKKRQPDIVFISCMSASQIEETKQLISKLREVSGYEQSSHRYIGVGGVCINQNPNTYSELGADFTAKDLRQVKHVLNNLNFEAMS